MKNKLARHMSDYGMCCFGLGLTLWVSKLLGWNLDPVTLMIIGVAAGVISIIIDVACFDASKIK